MRVGALVKIGWNGAKLFGAELLALELVRIEAIGADWVVVRTWCGKAYATGFVEALTLEEIQTELEE